MDENLRIVLNEIKQELKDIDAKWESHLVESSRDRAHLDNVSKQIAQLSKILLHGNGQKSVLVQVEQLQAEVRSLKDVVTDLNNEYKKANTYKQASQTLDTKLEISKKSLRIARWKTVGKVASILALAIPGILSFFGIGG